MSVVDIKEAVAKAADSGNDALIEQLAKLSFIEYDRRREKEAETLSIRVSTLDESVKDKRKELQSSENNNALGLDDPEPWDEPVDGGELVTHIIEQLGRYCVLPTDSDIAIAFWILHTYLMDVFFVSPFLALSSPEKRCGKTTLLTLISCMVRKPLPASNITPSAIFRSIELWQPTLLIDEGDTFLRANNDELRGILNSGHTRTTAFVIRTVGDDHTPAKFSTWGAKVLALIGNLPDTIQDRSVIVPMKRKSPEEKADRLRLDRLTQFDDITRKCARWASDNADAVKVADPALPENLNDRAADNWRSLMMIADVIGGDWPGRLKKSISELLSDSGEPGGLKEELLRDIRDIFDDESESASADGTKKLATVSLIDRLCKIDGSPWNEISNGKPITDRKLAGLLKPYGIRPKNLAFPGSNARPKGYDLKQFRDAFKRYLPAHNKPSAAAKSDLPATPLHLNKNNGIGENTTATKDNSIADENHDKLMNLKESSAVADSGVI